jgi:hypothetical protein
MYCLLKLYRPLLEVALARGDDGPLGLWVPHHLLLLPLVAPFAWRRDN